MVTIKQAVDYMHELVKKGGIDVDGYWGKQCVDLSNAIPKKFFNVLLGGNAIDLLNSAKAKGWKVEYDAPGVNPKAGAIFVSRHSMPYGHTGFIYKDSDGVTLYTIEQNIDGYSDNNRDGINDQLQVGGPARYHSRSFENIVGWFYPPYEDLENKLEKGNVQMSKDILIIAGHGAGDPGAVGGGYTEEGLMRQLAKAIQKYAPEIVNYDYDRNCFTDNGLYTYGLAKKYKQIVELHMDATQEKNAASGGHTIIYKGFKPDEIDKGLQGVVDKWVGTHRGHKATGGFSYRNNLQNLNVAAQSGYASYRLLELGFITHDTDRQTVVNNIDAIAKDIVNVLTGGKLDTGTKLKDLTTVAKEVLLGRWGNGAERKRKLETEGYNYPEVQKKVAELKRK